MEVKIVTTPEFSDQVLQLQRLAHRAYPDSPVTRAKAIRNILGCSITTSIAIDRNNPEGVDTKDM